MRSLINEAKQAQLDMAKRLLSTIYPNLNLEIKIKDGEKMKSIFDLIWGESTKIAPL